MNRGGPGQIRVAPKWDNDMNIYELAYEFFDNVWVVDTEYRNPDGEQKEVRCLCALNMATGEEVCKWHTPAQTCPIPWTEKTLMVVYSAGAESGYFFRAGWESKQIHVLDIRLLQLWIMNGATRWDNMMDEVLRETGQKKRKKNLQMAAKMAGVPLIEEKEEMRALVMSDRRSEVFSDDDRNQIINYCLTDVKTTASSGQGLWEIAKIERNSLFGNPLDDRSFLLMLINWSKYAWIMGIAEERGISADFELLEVIKQRAPEITDGLLKSITREIPGYDVSPNLALSQYLAKNKMAWPRAEKGNLSTKVETFRDMQGHGEVFTALYQYAKWKTTVQQLLKVKQPPDKRLRPKFLARNQATGRTTTFKPSPFGWAKWCRSLMRADPGKLLCYADYSQQEFLLQGVLSGDENMLTDYHAGDVYVAFARRSGLMPPDGTKQSHPQARSIAKGLILGLAYGMGEQSLATRIGCSVSSARKYIALHKKNYPVYWEFVQSTQATASLFCSGVSQLGWVRRYCKEFNPRSAQNFPIQAAGADCLIVATNTLYESGYDVFATIHDAVLVSLDDPCQVDDVKRIMVDSIQLITGGHKIRVDAEIFNEHYLDVDGLEKLREVLDQLDCQQLVPEAYDE